MRTVLVGLLLTLLPVQSGGQRTPVVVELFTSEGCSSCPPADRLLSDLAREQPIAGAEIIPLSLHVDYWDQLGWKDPASMRQATDRQQAYSRHFGEDTIYTPQAVVDGQSQMVGSDADAVRRAIGKAASQPHVSLALHATRDGRSALITVSSAPAADGRDPLDLLVALVEDDVNSAVTRGENKGHALHHDAVVRALRGGRADGNEHRATIALEPQWNTAHLKAVAFLQDHKSQRILGAASVPLTDGSR